jgi:citrate lyase subunit beta/citryl-CoA lyase
MTSRSWLFVPGDDARKIARGLAGPAHALILDWEDAVAASRKDEARRITREALATAGSAHGKRLWIRVNALDTADIHADLAALPVGLIDGVVLPKACGPSSVLTLDERLGAVEASQGCAAGRLKTAIVSTETAAAVLALQEFRSPLPRFEALMWGGEDLAADLGVRQNRDANGAYRSVFRLARDLTLLAAAATRALAIDAVFTNVRDLAALADECAQARADGFQAKAAIHPDQTVVINAVFQPSEAELDWARRVLQALDGLAGVAMLDGQMIDQPHRRLAQRLLGVAVD